MPQNMTFDREKAEQFVKHTGEQVAAAMNCYVSYVGLRLGLYSQLEEIGIATSEQLAEKTGLHERWIREWLRHQAANGQIEYLGESDSFFISPEAAMVLCNQESPFYFASGFEAIGVMRSAVDKLPEAFKTGIGMSYDDHGEACACNVENLNSFVPKNVLIPTILPQVNNVVEQLKEGIRVADVGCGSGTALLILAREFPNSEFRGYDISKHALTLARRNLSKEDLKNVSFHDVNEAPLPDDHSMEFITTFDVVHDAPFPQDLIGSIYGALSREGTWLCSDIRSFPTFAENLESNPSTALMYGFSLMVCMSSAMSVPGGAGLGTLGFNEVVAESMVRKAGFTHFEKLEYENAMNSYYEIKH